MMILAQLTSEVQTSDATALDALDDWQRQFEADHPVPETFPFNVATDQRVNALLRRLNDELPEPHPTCEACGFIHHPRERGVVLAHLCFSCESDRLFGLVWDLITAEGFRGWLRATFALMRLRRVARA